MRSWMNMASTKKSDEDRRDEEMTCAACARKMSRCGGK
jgi:hypothetical protein